MENFPVDILYKIFDLGIRNCENSQNFLMSFVLVCKQFHKASKVHLKNQFEKIGLSFSEITPYTFKENYSSEKIADIEQDLLKLVRKIVHKENIDQNEIDSYKTKYQSQNASQDAVSAFVMTLVYITANDLEKAQEACKIAINAKLTNAGQLIKYILRSQCNSLQSLADLLPIKINQIKLGSLGFDSRYIFLLHAINPSLIEVLENLVEKKFYYIGMILLKHPQLLAGMNNLKPNDFETQYVLCDQKRPREIHASLNFLNNMSNLFKLGSEVVVFGIKTIEDFFNCTHSGLSSFSEGIDVDILLNNIILYFKTVKTIMANSAISAINKDKLTSISATILGFSFISRDVHNKLQSFYVLFVRAKVFATMQKLSDLSKLELFLQEIIPNKLLAIDKKLDDCMLELIFIYGFFGEVCFYKDSPLIVAIATYGIKNTYDVITSLKLELGENSIIKLCENIRNNKTHEGQYKSLNNNLRSAFKEKSSYKQRYFEALLAKGNYLYIFYNTVHTVKELLNKTESELEALRTKDTSTSSTFPRLKLDQNNSNNNNNNNNNNITVFRPRQPTESKPFTQYPTTASTFWPQNNKPPNQSQNQTLSIVLGLIKITNKPSTLIQIANACTERLEQLRSSQTEIIDSNMPGLLPVKTEPNQPPAQNKKSDSKKQKRDETKNDNNKHHKPDDDNGNNNSGSRMEC